MSFHTGKELYGNMKISGINYLPHVNNYNYINKDEKNNDINTKPKEQWVGLSNVFYYPVNFGTSAGRTYSTDKHKLAEKTGNFQLLRFNDIPCPACGKKMLNLHKFETFVDEISEFTPDKYLECLGKYREYMRPVEESVYNELIELSQKSKNGEKDIRMLLVQLRDEKLPILQRIQMKKINKMRSLSRTLPDDEQKVLDRKIQGLASLIKKSNAEAPFRRKVMLDRISKVKIRNPRTYDKLQRIAASFPTSSDMNSAWIVKYSGKNKMDEDWDSYSIALRFLSSSIGNTDHILAYAIENNHDDISNYMAMHNACNSQKGSKHFLQWWNEDKENRTKYMQDYFDKADELIKTKKIKKKKYRHYVELAEQTIFDVSQGQLKLFKDEETFTEPKDQEEAQACQESEDFEEYEEAEDYEEDEEQPTDN